MGFVFSKKQRLPAWCDRILYFVDEDEFTGTKLGVNQEYYTSVPEYTISDHKPVISKCSIKVSRLVC